MNVRSTRRHWDNLPFWKDKTWKDISKLMASEKITPKAPQVFRALTLTPLLSVKAVIVGQDPYPNGEANGLAFSCNEEFDTPPSLRNIFTEYSMDLKLPRPRTTDLSPWAREGVLLLNSYLTTAPGRSLAHEDWGWEELTGQMIETVALTQPEAVFILWGRKAQDLALPLIGSSPRVKSAHPSPYSARNFFGSRPFTRTNALLAHEKIRPINWKLD